MDGSVVGDNVPANTVNTFAWRVSSDWQVDLEKVAVEVLAKEVDEGLVPLDFVTIPVLGDATGGLTCSINQITDSDAFNALLWLYADRDETLTLTNGILKNTEENGFLCVNSSFSVFYSLRNNTGRHIYRAMGYQFLNDVYACFNYARESRRENMASPYGYAKRRNVGEKGNGLYMVVDLAGSTSVSYLDTVPVGGWSADHKTRKLVLRRIDRDNGSYYVGVFPVTEAQWNYVMGTGDSKTSLFPKQVGEDDGCIGFMEQLRLASGISAFDLPFDDEWVYACRAGTTTGYYTGDTEEDLSQAGWYRENSGFRTHDVGEKTPNAWGLYDMHGNIWERCLDTELLYDNEMKRYWPHNVLRGGDFTSFAEECLFSCRGYQGYLKCESYVGFRVVCR